MRMLLKTVLLWIGRALRLGALLALWNGLVVGMVAVAYHAQLGFDALDVANWRSLHAYYLSGAVLDFRYLEIAGYGAMAALFGSLGFVVRSRSIWERMPSLTAFLPDPRLMRRPPSMTKRPSLRSAGTKSRSWTAGMTGMAKRIRPSRRGRAEGAAKGTTNNSAKEPKTVSRRVEPTVGPTILSSSMAQPSLEPAPTVPSSDVATTGDVVSSASDPVDPDEVETLEVGGDAHDRGTVEPAGGEDDETSDFAILSRAVALVEVWSSPPPEWMVLALRDELELLSADGWRMLEAFEAAALDLVDVIDDLGLLPESAEATAAFQTVREALFAEYRPPPEPVDDGFGPPVMASQEPVEDVNPGADGRVRQGMTLCASWFYEVIENFLMLEELRSGANALPPETFEQEWGGVLTETLEQLTLAQRSMTEADWGSLDQYPDRAQRARVLVDRLTGDQLVPRMAPEPLQDAGDAASGVASPEAERQDDRPNSPIPDPVEPPEPVELVAVEQGEAQEEHLFPAMPDLPPIETFLRHPAGSGETASSATAGRWRGVDPIDVEMMAEGAEVTEPPADGPPRAGLSDSPPRPAGVPGPGGPSDASAVLQAQGYRVMPYGMAPGYTLARRDSSVFVVRVLDLGGHGLEAAEDSADGGEHASLLGRAVADMDRVVRLARVVSARSASVRGVVVLTDGPAAPDLALAGAGHGSRDTVICVVEPGWGSLPLLQDIVADLGPGPQRVAGAL